jgi:hypothetical protein
VNCYFSDCQFIDCDPYYPTFARTVINPKAFEKCYGPQELNKALVLFAALKRGLEASGYHREARAADYYYRRWERELLYQRWTSKGTSGIRPWLWSLLVATLTGYGERPQYLAFWMYGLITVAAFVYWEWMPWSVSGAKAFRDYWYFSFKVFCAQGFTSSPITRGLLIGELLEFSLGLLLISLLLGSIARKLS